MQVLSYKTKKVVEGDDLFDILKNTKLHLKETDIVVVTSKIVSICEGRIVPLNEHTKDELAMKEADFFIPRPKRGPYRPLFTITRKTLLGVAGIDESNGDGHYVLYPKDPMQSAEIIQKWIKKNFKLKNIGVIITDSHSMPLRRGATGVAIGWSGIVPLKDYRGKKDVFGRTMAIEVANIVDAVAAAAVLVMGEGKEQTPLAVVRNAPISFTQEKRPGEADVFVSLKDDLFGMFLNAHKWKKGG